LLAHPLEYLFHPQSIAVVGASGNPNAQGYGFTTALIEYGYRGLIYPVNPKYENIAGLKAYPSLEEIPGPVDYVISCVPAPHVLRLLKDCARKGVKVVHLYTARFSETGRPEAVQLEREVLQLARTHGIRLIGPNCMGLYCPKEGIAFSDALPKQAGPVGLVSQSGQAVEEITRFAALRNVFFSKVISYGNAIDFNECDFLDYLTHDPETALILMYIEGLRDGRRFFHTVRRAAATKPVVILKGGRGESGARAAASHTASLAGSTQIWDLAMAQAGAISADSLEELVDLAVSFRFLPPVKGRRVGVAGGAGGASVLAADQCEKAGLAVIPLPPECREELKAKGITIWDWIGNPADMSIREAPGFDVGDMLEMMAKNDNFDVIIAILGEPHHERQRGMSVDDYLGGYKLKQITDKPLLAVMGERGLGIHNYDDWNWKIMYEARTRLLADDIPFYPTIGRAAMAARKLADYYQRKEIAR